MRFSELVKNVIRISACDKDGAIRELVAGAIGHGIPEDCSTTVANVVVAREELGSTGVGRGVAVPQGKHGAVDGMTVIAGFSLVGVDFKALDGEPVYIFFLVLCPSDMPGDALRTIEFIARELRDDVLLGQLKRAQSNEEFQRVLDDADAQR